MWSAWVSLVSFHGHGGSCGLHGSVLFPFMVMVMWSAWVSLVSFHGNRSCGLHGSVLFPFMVIMWSAWVVSFHGSGSCGLHGSVLFPFMVIGHVVCMGQSCFLSW